MMRIGKTYIEQKDDKAYLCADIVVNEHRTTLWFAVERSKEAYLCVGRSDPFVMALLPGAMRGGHEMICEDPISGRLYCQLSDNLIPALSFESDLYHLISITAPYTDTMYPNVGAVGTGFSGGVDSLYTIFCHEKDSEYPLTHLAVFNSGAFDRRQPREIFTKACKATERFAKEQNLETVFVDTNFVEVLPERFLDVYSFRNLACALALQGLFSVYLLSSGHDAANFQMDLRNSATYDGLTVFCASTEGLAFYLSGVEVKRRDKLKALLEWEPSKHWLHPCLSGIAGEKNCSRCRKCIRDLTKLYAWNRLDYYNEVFDVKDYQKNVAKRIGYMLVRRGGHLFDEALETLEENHVPIPQAAYVYEKHFRNVIAMQNTRRREMENAGNDGER